MGAQCVNSLANEDIFPLEGAAHLPYDPTTGYQVLLPDLKFNCHGRVTSWSALAIYKNINYTTSLNYVVNFQVWRPLNSGRRQYELVGANYILAPPYQLKYNVSQDDFLVTNLNKTVEEEWSLYFQPGDIIGFYSPRKDTKNPLYHHIPYYNWK